MTSPIPPVSTNYIFILILINYSVIISIYKSILYLINIKYI
ncbi:hypothetical protein CNEO4_1980007 [Clostridium neonatale]|nr:hypothetical protein CNEO3_1070007 [Clostridium neonatale]CAI3602552.1 hypothetical protein CNEO4_1870004 [Clostridium neonatale]CAI3603828.1 hypothetical protein CNEO4_1550007 [Clostridium neonatale]CAI3621468.1 hypothetical protein CNEO2_1690007 [Clostridium neonatale]CAI3635952.1 hypothetical protein CNEO4_2000007 [Clostridium neonatale]